MSAPDWKASKAALDVLTAQFAHMGPDARRAFCQSLLDHHDLLCMEEQVIEEGHRQRIAHERRDIDG